MTTRIPPKKITGPYGVLVTTFSKRMFGRVPESLGVMWHNVPVMKASMGFGRKMQKWDHCDKTLTSFAHMAVASYIGCSWCLDFNYFMAFNEGLDVERAREILRWRESDVFTPLEREVFQYGARDTDAVRTVRIVQLSAEALRALAAGDLVAAQQVAPVPLSPWFVSADSRSLWRRRATQVAQTPSDLAWVTGVVFDDGTGRAVGAGGFHAAPTADGMVEAGYRIDPEFRRRGYARSTLQTLIARAHADPAVRVLRLTISPDNEPSLALAGQFPFVKVGEQWDDEDGLEDVLEMPVVLPPSDGDVSR